MIWNKNNTVSEFFNFLNFKILNLKKDLCNKMMKARHQDKVKLNQFHLKKEKKNEASLDSFERYVFGKTQDDENVVAAIHTTPSFVQLFLVS